MLQKLAVCLPSRGLVHSRTIQGLLTNLVDAVVEWDLFFTHDRPIPDCFNDLTEAAIDNGSDAIWFVEEDMELPDGILDQLIMEMSLRGADVVAADYAIEGNPSCLHFKGDTLMSTGMGCMLAKASVFTKIGQPYFRDTFEYGLPEWVPIHMVPGTGYGRQDVDFGVRLHQNGL